MIKEERINKRSISKRINFNVERLSCSSKTMEDIFKISFSHPSFTLFNVCKNGEVQNISYGEVKDEAFRFANYFEKTIENKTKYVGLLLDNSPKWVSSFYGLLMAGYIPVLLSTASSNEDNIDILSQLDTTYVVTNKEIKLNKINPFEINEEKEIDDSRWENKVVLVTSGTTGKAKIYLYTGAELSNQILEIPNIIKRTPNLLTIYKGYAKQFLVLPLYHIFGFTATFLWFSFFNIPFVLPESLTPEKIKEAALLTHPTHLLAVPLFWELIARKILQKVKESKKEQKFEKALKFSIFLQKRFPKTGPKYVRNKLLKKYLKQVLGSSLGFCVTGGTAVSEDTLRIINGLGYNLVNGYGSTEIGISSFSNTKNVKDRLLTTIGNPFTNYKYEVSPEKELLVTTEAAYNSVLVDKKFVERNFYEPIKTNDLCDIEFDKYYVKGRIDEIYVGRNGENYSLPRIEKSLRADYANNLVCFSQDHKLNIILSYDKSVPHNLIKKDLSNIIHNENFTKYSIRKILVTNDDIPQANGLKVKRHELASLLEKGEIRCFDIPMEDIEEEKITCDDRLLSEIIKLFSETTLVENVESNSDFFIDLGGDSLSYFDLVSKIENRFEMSLEINVNTTRTPLHFAALVEATVKKENKDLHLQENNDKLEKSQRKTGKFNFLHFVARFFIKLTGLIPLLIFISPRYFYSSNKAKKESRKVKGGAILIGNHTSTFDYISLVFKYLFKVVHTFVGPAIYRFKSLRHLCNMLENIEVKKDDSANYLAQKKARAYLLKGKVVALFPEGRFEDNPGEIERFSSSAVRLSFETNKPIIPHYFKGNYGLFKRAKINVGEKIYVRDLVKKDTLTNEDIEYVNKYVRDRIKKLKHQLYCFETHKTRSRFAWRLFISDLFKVTGFPFGYLVFWATKKYAGDKKKVRKAMREGVILAPNHTSFFDVVFMYLYFVTRRLRILSLKKAVGGKFLHPLTRGAGVIEYDRDAKGGFDFRSFKETDEILEGNGCVVMFPQGHIEEDGSIRGDLKQGIAMHSLRQNIPVIPMVFQKVTRPIKPNRFIIGDPLYPADYFDSVVASKENIAKFTDIIQTKMLELQSISQNLSKK